MVTNDLISRQNAIDDIEKHIRTAEEPYQLTDTDRILNHAFDIAASCVYNLPSAQQWIPCSERLPSEPFGCIVTVWDSTPTGEGDDFENILPYFVGWDGEQWNDGDGEQCPFEVIAWMQLPKPYKGEEQ